MKLKAQKELERSKAALDRRAAQLEQDKARKQEILQRAHMATSRTAQISPKKVFAFGSSTPRELSYLEKLSKDQKQYDKRLHPADAGKSPTSSPPREVKKPNAMTASLYVPAKTSPQKAPVNRARRSGVNDQKSTPTKSPAMTQSLYVPSSKKVIPVRSVPKPSPPKRTPPSRESKKPPLPARATQKTPEKKSPPQSTPVPKAIIPRKSVQAPTTLPSLTESPRNPEAAAPAQVVEQAPIPLNTQELETSTPVTPEPVILDESIVEVQEVHDTEISVSENEQVSTPVKEIELINLSSPAVPVENFVDIKEEHQVEDIQEDQDEQDHIVPENPTLDTSALLESIAEPIPLTPDSFGAPEVKEEEHYTEDIQELETEQSSIILGTQVSGASVVAEPIPVDPVENITTINDEHPDGENQENINAVAETVQPQESKETEPAAIKIEPTEILSNGDGSIVRLCLNEFSCMSVFRNVLASNLQTAVML